MAYIHLGIEYLREYLHLPPEIVPATLKRQPKTDSRARPRAAEPRSPSGREADRDQYRRGGMESKPAGAGSDFQPEFVSTLFVVTKYAAKVAFHF